MKFTRIAMNIHKSKIKEKMLIIKKKKSLVQTTKKATEHFGNGEIEIV